MGPDWSLLLPELLQVLSEKVTSLADYIRFRAVCHPWRSASPPCPHHLPVQLPWLMLPYQYVDNDDSIRCFYDLSTSQIHRLNLLETLGAKICGSSHGWLALSKDGRLSLLNPITRATITLPPFFGPPHPFGFPPRDVEDDGSFFENWDADRYTIKPPYDLDVTKAILTSSSLDPSCMVFISAYDFWLLSVCKIGDEHWTVIEFEYENDDILDFTYSNGCLYTIHTYAEVTMYNLNTLSRVMLNCFVETIDSDAGYLVDGMSQDVLFVAWHTNIVEAPEWETDYIVYKLSNDQGHDWINMRDIGQNVLFVGGYKHAFSLSSTNLHLQKWGANCLCYDTFYDHNIKLARIDDGTVNVLTGDLYSSQNNWRGQTSKSLCIEDI